MNFAKFKLNAFGIKRHAYFCTLSLRSQKVAE